MVTIQNQCQLIGNIGSELELKKTGTGKSQLRFSLATNYKYKDSEGKHVERTDWHKIVAYGTHAEIIHNYCEKGSRILVSGRITTRQYKDKDEVDRSITELIVNSVFFLDTKKHAQKQEKESVHTDTEEPPY